ncbi:MAG: type II toxin-antitoxin system RelB/DinJ family antitoxin [Mycoplasmataceae bacterium]|jgi:addiction module RelB/DinJ family antitoxin|nr:type II toxin-antitoxin system RelB/DinJ family antitoxin [Mycoplasmataceae bacterium]
MENVKFINFRITESDKKSFEEFSKTIGLSESAILTAFIKKVISTRKIPFEFSEHEKQEAVEVNQNIQKSMNQRFLDSLDKLKEQVERLQAISKQKLKQ